MNVNNLINKMLVKLVLAIVLMGIIRVIEMLVPTLTNDIAMTQMSNDDISFMLFNNWQKISSFLASSEVFIICIYFCSVFYDTIKFLINRGENN